MLIENQNTLKNPTKLTGVGLHSGSEVSLIINPAPEDYGIVFRRTDVANFDNFIRADYRNDTKTQLGTVISNSHGTLVSTIEHLMAALWGEGIDNALIDVSAAEVPIMDGSSDPFIAMIENVGVLKQNAKRKQIKVIKEVEVTEEDKFAKITPSDDFSIDLEIDFNSKAIPTQKRIYSSNTPFKEALGKARTFGFAHEVDYLRSIGLARGGSLDNAIVIKDDKILNKEGLRFDDEFVRHKLLDCIGDFYLAGKRLIGNVKAYKTGHKLNNMLLHRLFSDKTAFEVV
jgi:UDP-3-O-[3-hydroxymyristoyl] N-acetylglucosamine deacetylase